jgi:hypothetical protein
LPLYPLRRQRRDRRLFEEVRKQGHTASLRGWKSRDRIEIGDIRRSLSLVRDAKKIISNDTGLAHCAGAMNKDILILWKDTPFIKNQNPGKKTIYSQKQNWIKDINNYL